MSPIGRRKKTPTKERRGNREIAGSAVYPAMLDEILQLIKAFKKMGGVKPRLSMRDMKRELKHGG